MFRVGDTLQQGQVLERREQDAYDSTWTAVWGPQRRVGKAQRFKHSTYRAQPFTFFGSWRASKMSVT